MLSGLYQMYDSHPLLYKYRDLKDHWVRLFVNLLSTIVIQPT